MHLIRIFHQLTADGPLKVMKFSGLQIFLVVAVVAITSFTLAVFFTMSTLHHDHMALPDEVQSDISKFVQNNLNVQLNGDSAAAGVGSGDHSLLEPVAHKTETLEAPAEAQLIVNSLVPPRRYPPVKIRNPPPTLDEVKSNLTYYLRTLHDRLAALASPTVSPFVVWDTYVEVTRDTIVVWDDMNRQQGRYYEPRKDKSIFVSISTYRDHLCPMTVKSLFANANHPERLNVAIFQQNCFETKCRTGVLVGGKVEDTSTDVNCHTEFCASPEGIRSNACHTGQIRLFNVNESESLGPYMARFISGKLYQGEQYYLQIDSHSEFVQGWDDKLIKMVVDAPAKKPIISAYPPDSHANWKNTPGFRMCDSTIAQSQIEWHIIRLEASLPPSTIPPVPDYAPFVAAGFLFGVADFLHEVPFDPFLPWIFMGEGKCERVVTS